MKVYGGPGRPEWYGPSHIIPAVQAVAQSNGFDCFQCIEQLLSHNAMNLHDSLSH